MDYHLGEEIRKVILQHGMTFKTFADRFGMTDRNLQNFFKRNDFSIDQLKRASEILEHNFINEYLSHVKGGDKLLNISTESKPKDYINLSFTVTISGLQSQFEKFPELLKSTRLKAESLGFKVL